MCKYECKTLPWYLCFHNDVSDCWRQFAGCLFVNNNNSNNWHKYRFACLDCDSCRRMYVCVSVCLLYKPLIHFLILVCKQHIISLCLNLTAFNHCICFGYLIFQKFLKYLVFSLFYLYYIYLKQQTIITRYSNRKLYRRFIWYTIINLTDDTVSSSQHNELDMSVNGLFVECMNSGVLIKGHHNKCRSNTCKLGLRYIVKKICLETETESLPVYIVSAYI